MYDPPEVYRLAFVPAGKWYPPLLIIEIRSQFLEELNGLLHTLVQRGEAYADEYCRSPVPFSYPVPDLFGHIAFGYGRCGRMKMVGDWMRVEIMLAPRKQLYCCTLTIQIVTQALTVLAGDAPHSDQLQQVHLSMVCDRKENGYGHAMSGDLTRRMIDWLQRCAAPSAEEKRASVLEEVVEAMQQAWRAVTTEGRREWARECKGRIAEDGRFMLECFGNACDIAIYPDGSCGNMGDSFVQFSCHNLDHADQQITLLAGLAKLCELARNDEG